MGLSRQALADASDSSMQLIFNAETGKVRTSFEKAAKIFQVLGVSLGDLDSLDLFREEAPPKEERWVPRANAPQQLRKLRQKHNEISQGRLADLAGLHPQAISHYESGRRKLTYSMAMRILLVLQDAKIEDLMEEQQGTHRHHASTPTGVTKYRGT